MYLYTSKGLYWYGIGLSNVGGHAQKPQFTINDFPFFIMTDRVKPHLLVIVCAPWDVSAHLV